MQFPNYLSLLGLSLLLSGCLPDWDDAWNTEVVSGCISTDTIWTNDKIWVLDGLVVVAGNLGCSGEDSSASSATLTIEEGTQIRGLQESALLVASGGLLKAKGTKAHPIVFTSAQAEPQPGDWGGITLLGDAPVSNGVHYIEGIEESPLTVYGGSNPQANCGQLEHVVVTHAGYRLYANNELNGLTLGGCGRNTVVHNIGIFDAYDDGVEIFGGTVDIKNILVQDVGDDALDWDLGWNGRAQFLFLEPGHGQYAIEGSSFLEFTEESIFSIPLLYNVTLVSSGNTTSAILLKDNTRMHLLNSVFVDFNGFLLQTDLASILREDDNIDAHGLYYPDAPHRFSASMKLIQLFYHSLTSVPNPILDAHSGYPSNVDVCSYGNLLQIITTFDFFEEVGCFGAVVSPTDSWVSDLREAYLSLQ